MPLEKAILLAAGVGTRLKPITSRIPKPLINIAGKPLICWILDHIGSCKINHFIIVINPEHEKLFKEALAGHDAVIEYTYQEEPTGMTDAILTTRKHLTGDVIISAGDMITPGEHIKEMIGVHESTAPFATLSLFKSSVDHLQGLGNVAMDASGIITKIIEKPAKDEVLGPHYSLPFYIFNEQLLEYLEKCPISKRGERELQDAIQLAIDDGKSVKGVTMQRSFSTDITEFQKEMGAIHITNPTDYFNCNLQFMKSMGIKKPLDILCTMIEPVFIGKGCTIADDCLIGPNVVIEDGVESGALSEVSNAIIGKNTMIGKKCYLENVIVLEGTMIVDNTELKGSKDDIKVIE